MDLPHVRAVWVPAQLQEARPLKVDDPLLDGLWGRPEYLRKLGNRRARVHANSV